MKNDRVLAILSSAAAKGADAAEVYEEIQRETSVLVSQRTVEVVKTVTGTGLGIRLWKDSRVGFGSTSNTDRDSTDRLLDEILDNITRLPPSEDIRPAEVTPEDRSWTEDLSIIDPVIIDLDKNLLVEKIQEQVSASFDYSRLVSICREARISARVFDIRLANSEGLDQSYQKTTWDTEMALIAENAPHRNMKFHGAAGVFLEDWNPVLVGEQAAQKSILSLGGTKQPYSEVPVIINNAAMIPILAMLSAGFYGERIDNHMSVFGEKEGQMIASSLVSLVNDGRMDRGYYSSPFDGEGVPTQRTTIIDRGKLHGFLHTAESARKRGIVSNGCAQRLSYTQQPSAGHSNLFLQTQKTPPEDLVRGITEGFYLFDAIDPRAIDTVSGKIQLNADGLWINNGSFGKAISDVSVSADLFDFFKSIDAVANDMIFQPMHPFFGGGYVGSPTIRVKSMVVVGQ